jgi:hypothetical protein
VFIELINIVKFNNMNSKAIEAYRILNDLLGDLIIGTRTVDLYSHPIISSQMSESFKIGVTRLCVFHLIISLNKFIEFYHHYKNIIPEDVKDTCKGLMKILKEKKVPDYRNKVAGHIWDKNKKSPITEEEHDYYSMTIYGNNYDSFLLWINNPNKNIFPETVVSIVEHTKNVIAKKYSLSDTDIYESQNNLTSQSTDPRFAGR